MNSLNQLEEFGQSVYELLGNGRDALFDLMDAVLVSRSVCSFAKLSLSPMFRRGWSSAYAAIADYDWCKPTTNASQLPMQANYKADDTEEVSSVLVKGV